MSRPRPSSPPPPTPSSTHAGQKRRRTPSPSLPTPPLSTHDASSSYLLSRAVTVLSTAATALSQVTFLYQSDPVARDGLVRAVQRIQRVHAHGGKLVVCGVGKSGLVGKKLVATLKSLGCRSAFLHPTEALHGDLGDLGEADALLFLSNSGKTPELVSLLPHIPAYTPILAITSHTNPADCVLLSSRPDSILLPAPVHEAEDVSFGVSAPTTSTTVAIAVGDMLALTLAGALYEDGMGVVFRRNHPGGVIGEVGRRKRGRMEEEDEEERVARRCSGLASPA